MRVILNIIWLIFGGLFAAIGYFLIGVILCITIIGIPLGLQVFKIGQVMIWPFGTTVVTNFEKHPIANILWLIFIGIYYAGSILLLSLILCITIIGIPFAKQWFKLLKLILIPFGATIS